MKKSKITFEITLDENKVPEKFPANVPKDPAAVVNDGAVDAVIIAFVDLAALPSSSSTLT